MKIFVFINLFLVSINTYSYDRFNDHGVLVSSIKREPQVIRVEEIKDQALIIFKFCETIESDRCEILGRKEGYSEIELNKLSNIVKLDANTSAFLKPFAISAALLIGTGLAIVSGGTSLGIMAISTSTASASGINNHKESDADVLDRIGRVTNPESRKSPMKIQEQISIVSLSYLLEKKLKTLDDPCFVYPDTSECLESKEEIMKRAKKIGDKFNYNLK